MDPQVVTALLASAITGISVISAASIVALINLKLQSNKLDAQAIRHELQDCKDRGRRIRNQSNKDGIQITSFRVLEDEYSTELEKLLSASSRESKTSIQTRLRDRVAARGFERPS